MNTTTIRKAAAIAAAVAIPASILAAAGTADAATPQHYTVSVTYVGNNGYQIAARNFSAASSTAFDEVGLEVDGVVVNTFHKTFSSHGTWTVSYRAGHHITVRAIDRTDPNFDGVNGYPRSNDWDFTTGGTATGHAVKVSPFYVRP